MKEQIGKPFIHFHIPKTAGTSLRATFVDEYGPEAVAFKLYTGELAKINDLPFTNVERLDKMRRIARTLGLLNAYSATIGFINSKKNLNSFGISELVHSKIVVATGHFTSADITEEVANIPRTSVLRDPLSRMQSHYAHWREAEGNMWWHSGQIEYGDDVSFEAFATDEALANYQTEVMGELGFVVLGSTVHLPEFFEEVGIAQPSIPQLNPRKTTTSSTSLDDGFLREFTEMHNADYELFTTVTENYA